MTPEHAENVARLLLLTIYFLFVAIGILLNGFIVIVNLNRWRKSQPLQAIDLIITCLAALRIILLFLYTEFIIELLFSKSVFQVELSCENMMTLVTSVEYCSLWWGSILCVYYCVKITNYSHRLFIRLKMNISKMVPRLLLVSVIPSGLCSLPFKWFVCSMKYDNVTDGETRVVSIIRLNDFIIYFSGSIIPFIIFCICVGLVIVSLLRHTRHLGSRGYRFNDAQRDIHISVIQNMVSFLLFYVLSFLGSSLISLNFESPMFIILCAFSYTAFPSLHSISIIVSNRELKKSLLTALCCSSIRE